MTENAYRRMFFVAALWNLAGGVFIIAATAWLFASAGLPVPSPSLYYYAWIALFMTFGIGYYMVFRDMYRNRDIVLLGAIGKLAFAAVFLYQFVTRGGEIPRFFLVPVVGDLVFVVLFVLFLRFAARKGMAP